MMLTLLFLEIVFNETNQNDFGSTFQITDGSKVILYGNQLHNNVHMLNITAQDEELVKWATQKFGGVTSFTTIRNVKAIRWTGREGENYL